MKTIIAIFLFFCQLLQSLFAVGTTPEKNEGIEFEDISSAVIVGEYAPGDEDPVIALELENTQAVQTVTADMFELTELFDALEITDVAQSGAVITLFTDGVIPYEIPLTGGVNISASATEAATELRAECELALRSICVKQDSFVLDGSALCFTLVCLNGTFVLNEGDEIKGDDRIFTVKSVSADGSAAALSVPVAEAELEGAVAQLNGAELVIPAEMLSYKAEQKVIIYADNAEFEANVKRIAKTDAENVYKVTAVLFVKNGAFADELTVADISLGGAFESAEITALTKSSGTYTLEFTFEKSGINLNKVKLEGTVALADNKVKNHRGTALSGCSADLTYVKDGFHLDGYKQITAFIPAETGIFDKIADIGNYIGTAAGIAGGVITALEMVGILESTDAKVENIRKIVKEIQVAITALDEKLDNMGTTITAGTVETMSAIQYNTYVTASGNWDQFLGSYVTPLQNELNEFTMAYNDYMLTYIMNAHSELHAVTVWKDVDGNITLPHPANGANTTLYSVDGKVLASYDAYTLTAELTDVQSKVMLGGGRLYDGYWEDITAEINDSKFDWAFVDITKEEYLEAVQMNASLYALEKAGTTDILNAFTAFCNAIAGDGSAGGLKPLDNYLTMLSMYYNFYIESAKDIETTLTWLYSILTEGAFAATLAYNFTPSAQNDIVNKSFDKAAAQISKASAPKDSYYSYIANKTVTVSEINHYELNSVKGLLRPSHETDLYLGNSWDGVLIQPDTLKTGNYMDEVQMSLMFKRYEYLCRAGVCDDPSFQHYVVSLGLVDNNVLFDSLVYPKNAIIIASPISIEEIPLDNSVEMEITRIWSSTWYKPGDVITIGSQGKVSDEYYTTHFRRCADTMDFNGNMATDTVLLGQASYYESHWYWGIANAEDWACVVVYPDTMLVFLLG